MLLRGLNVVEISASGAAAWATKDLADWGANVVVLEPPEGSPLRNEPPWYEREGERRSATWQWLSRGKTVVAAGPGLPTTPEDALALCREADLVVAEHEPLAALLGLDHAGVRAALAGHSVVVRIAAFAPDGPYAHYRATDLGICSLGGWTGMLGAPDRYPLRPAGDLGTRATGLHALAAALFALRHHERGAAPSFVEVSAQAVAASLLTSPWLAYSMFGTTGFRRTASWPNASVRCKDGHAGILPLTHQHWASLCELTGLADVLDEPGGRELSYRQEHGAELWERVHEWYELRTREQVYFAGQAVRVPSGPVDSVSQRLGDEQLEARGFFERAVVDGVMLRVPRVPYRIAGAPTLPRGAATEEQRASFAPSDAGAAAGSEAEPPELPMEGVRIIDLTWFWSGPHATMNLGAFGADVIKVESVSRPDSYRFTGAAGGGSQPWERNYLWNDSNQNKRGLTVDLNTETGRGLFERLLCEGDVMVSNFSNRVLPNLGYTAERLHEINPRLISVTMPGYGPDGPWGDFVGFGSTFEQAVVSSMNGYPDDNQPRLIGGACDPLVGMNAVVAIQLALRHREQSGLGTTVEVPQCEVLDAMFGPEHIAVQHGAPDPGLRGNKHDRMAPHEVYQTAGEDDWISIAVDSDDQFAGLVSVLGQPALTDDPRFVSAEARKANEDELDELVAAAVREREPVELEAALQAVGVAGCRVTPAYQLTEDVGLRHFGFFQELTREVTGTHLYKTFPFRFSGFPAAHRRLAPLLGEHNRELLSELLGLGEDELDALEAAGEIGTTPSWSPTPT